MNLDSVTITSTSAVNNGGTFYINDPSQSITATGITITTSTAGGYGGVFNI